MVLPPPRVSLTLFMMLDILGRWVDVWSEDVFFWLECEELDVAECECVCVWNGGEEEEWE